MVRQRQQVAIVADSSCCLPAALAEKWGVVVVPHELTLDGVSYRDGVDLAPQEFYRKLKTLRVAPTTAAPPPERFREAVAAAREIAPHALCLIVSANFSATLTTAQAAARQLDAPHQRVLALDSQAAAGALGLLALAAARRARQGAGLEEVKSHVQGLIPQLNLVAFLDTLEYLSRGGRVSKLKAWAGSLLGVKPITELKQGEARLLERPRSRTRAMERLIGILRQRVGDAPARINVMEADAPADAEALRRRVESEFNCRQLFVSQFTPVMGAHIGPGLLGLAFHIDTETNGKASP